MSDKIDLKSKIYKRQGRIFPINKRSMKERDMLTISLIPHPSKQKKQCEGIKRKSKQL